MVGRVTALACDEWTRKPHFSQTAREIGHPRRCRLASVGFFFSCLFLASVG